MFCECGCGQKTTLAPKTNTRQGYVKGQPRRFIHNHQSKGKHLTEEHREHISIGNIGTTRPRDVGIRGGTLLTDEQRAAISEAHRKPWNPDTGKAPISWKISQREFWRMIEAQDARCGLCWEPFTRMPRVDHDHVSGAIRMLLCNGCNSNFERVFDTG